MITKKIVSTYLKLKKKRKKVSKIREGVKKRDVDNKF